VSNVFNVGKHIRKETTLKVSPTFIEEAKGRIEDLLNEIVPEAEQMAKAEGMRTLQEHHLIRVYDFRKPVDYRIVTCEECKHAFGVTGADIDHDLSCPFCHKKRGIIKE
jgi:histone H3/H4